MSSENKTHSVFHDAFFKRSFWSTITALVACLATHLLTLFGIVGAVAWLSDVEHALVIALIGFAVLTVYAFFRHKRCRH